MSRTSKVTPFYRGSNLLEQKGNVKPVTLTLPPAHRAQYDFLQMLNKDGTRFALGACGTKFGKTFGTTSAIVKNAWDNKDSLNWWISPTFEQATMAFGIVQRLLPQGTFKAYLADKKLAIIQPDGSERSMIAFKSADNPDSLRGFGVNFFVMDEAARCAYESWISLFTTVTQTGGVGYIISTPKGRNWFYDIYQWGIKFDDDGHPLYEDGKSPEEGGDPHPEFMSVCMPTWANPHVPLESIKSMKRTMPEDVYRQEVEAKFLIDSAGVFRGIKECIRGEFEEPNKNSRYVMGVDLARIRDYSVLTVMDKKERKIVHFERFNQISWEVQYKKIIDTAKKYKALCCIDSTGLGDPIVEAIQNAGVKVFPYKIGGSAAKQQLIDKLRVNIEKQRVSFPFIPVLKRELEIYEYQVSPNGMVKFSAPPGSKDDCVISFALANWCADQPEFMYTYRQIRGI